MVAAPQVIHASSSLCRLSSCYHFLNTTQVTENPKPLVKTWLQTPATSPLRSGTPWRNHSPRPLRLTRLQRSQSRVRSMTICRMTLRYGASYHPAVCEQSILIRIASSAVLCPRGRSTFGCSSSARCTPSCKYTYLRARHPLQRNSIPIPIPFPFPSSNNRLTPSSPEPPNSSSQPSSAPSPSSTPPTEHGFSPTSGS